MREAGRQLREREPLPDFELRGPIVKLERGDGASTGKSTIVGLLDDRQRCVTVQLDDAQYQVAVHAHGNGHSVNGIGGLAAKVVAEIDRPTALIAQPMGAVIAILVALERPAQVTHLVLTASSGGLDISDLGASHFKVLMQMARQLRVVLPEPIPRSP